jgi:hypothetical protein
MKTIKDLHKELKVGNYLKLFFSEGNPNNKKKFKSEQL